MSANSVDPNLKNDTTDEFIVGVDREIGAGFAVGASYIWRQLRQLLSGTIARASSTADFVPVTFTPAASACPAPTATDQRRELLDDHLLPARASSSRRSSALTNIPGFNRNYNGVELTGRKRLSHHWLMNTSFAYNSTIVNFGSFPGSQPSSRHRATIIEDPTNRANRDGYQYRLPDARAAASATSTSTPSGCSR